MNQEIFYTLLEAKVLVDRCKTEYNTVRPHSSLNYQPPAPEVIKLKCPQMRLLSLKNWYNLLVQLIGAGQSCRKATLCYVPDITKGAINGKENFGRG